MTNTVPHRTHPKLLVDEPALDDKFESHFRIAKAINKLIENNEGGKTISIEGAWGSGKSTVISLLKNNLFKDKDDKKIITYDAWAHSGDPLRRSFLNYIIDELSKFKWIDNPKDEFINKHPVLKNLPKPKDENQNVNGNIEFWGMVKASLSGTFKVTNRENEHVLERDGVILIVLLMIFPFASQFAVNMYKGYLLDQYFFIQWPLWVHVLCLVCTFLVIAPFWHLRRVYKKGEGKKILSLLVNKSTISEKTTSKESKEPTSIEFQEIFASVMDMALEKDYRRLVIVVDNLDRLKAEEAEGVWSLLRSFIDPHSFNKLKHTWINNIWVVIPIASNVIKKNESIVDDQDTSNINKEISRGNHNQLQKKPEQFLDKVFQVRYKIPPPVLTNWEEYLNNLIDVAFGSNFVKIDEKRIIHWLYDHYQSEVSKSRPTPRSLLLFINEIVSLNIIWGNKFSLATLAAFAIDTKEKDVLAELQSNSLPSSASIPSSTSIKLLGSNTKKDFAAIFFNIDDTDKALELLYTPLIESHLKNGKNSELIKFFESEKFAWDCFSSHVKKWFPEWSNSNEYAFFNALIVIEALVEKKIVSHDSLNPIYKYAESEFESFNGLPLLTENVHEGYIAFFNLSKFNLTNNNSASKTILNSLKRFFSEETSEFNPDSNFNYNVNIWSEKLDSIIKSTELSEYLAECDDFSIRLPIEYGSWLDICDTYLSSNFEIWRKFRPIESLQDISSLLSKNIVNKGVNEDDELCINWMANIDSLSKFKAVFDVIESRLDSININESESLITSDLYLKNFYRQEAIRDSSKRLLNIGAYHKQYYYLQRNNAVECQARILCLILLSDISHPLPPQYQQQHQFAHQDIKDILNGDRKLNDDFMKAILEAIETYSLERLFIDLSLCELQSHSNIALLASSYKNKNKIYDAFDINNIDTELFSYINKLCTDTSDEQIRKEVTKYLIEERNLIEILLKNGLKPNDFYLYMSIQLAYPDYPENYTHAMMKLLSSLKRVEWTENLKKFTSLGRLLSHLSNQKIQLQLGRDVYESLIEIFNYKSKESDISLGIKAALNFLNPNLQKKLGLHLIASIQTSDTPISVTSWQCYGDFIINSLTSRTGKSKIIGIIKKLVHLDDKYGLNTIFSKLNNHNNLIDPFSSECTDLRGLITAKAKKNTDQEYEKLLNKIKRFIRRTYI